MLSSLKLMASLNISLGIIAVYFKVILLVNEIMNT